MFTLYTDDIVRYETLSLDGCHTADGCGGEKLLPAEAGLRRDQHQVQFIQ